MTYRKRSRKALGLNTTSTADISFVLLIFFLVTTSMDMDKGLARQLPQTETQDHQAETQVEKEAVLALQITATDQLMADGEPIGIGEAGKRVAQLLKRQGKNHLITIETDPEARYDSYFQLQDAIVSAYREYRDLWAQQHYGRPYRKCSPAQRKAAREACPQRIMEHDDNGEGGARP